MPFPANTIVDNNQSVVVHGHLDFQTTPLIWRNLLPVIKRLPALHFNFARVEGVSSSAALALLIEWIRYAEKSGKPLTFTALPAQLLCMARNAGMGEMLEKYCQP